MKISRLGLISISVADILSESELAVFEHETFEKGNVIYAQEPTIIILLEGGAKLSFLEYGDEFIIYHMQSENLTILDESCVIEFLESSKILKTTVQNTKFLLQNHKFADVYSKALLGIIMVQRQISKSVLFEDAKGRIATFLIELAEEQNLKQHGFWYIFLPFSVKILSSFVGLKRQSASTAINELIKEGIIRKVTQHEFLILDKEKLRSYSNL